MSNKTTTSILEYAEVHRDFSMDDLFAYLHEKVGISKSSLSWYLFKLVNENALVRTGRGMYAKVMKQSFVPKLIGEVREIYDSLLVNFPFAKFCVYQGILSQPCSITFLPTVLSMWKQTGFGRNGFQLFERREP